MIFLRKFIEYSIFISAILLAFLLSFERYLLLPDFLSWIGHWHPLVLHFPIVLVLVTIIQYWRKDEYIEWYLSVTTLATMFTAITGFLLSLEGGSKGDNIIIHQWLGVAAAYLIALWYWFSESKLKGRKIYLPLQSVLIVLIVITGHFGGMITHGEDFLSWNRGKQEIESELSVDPNIYQYFVQPVLDQKCASCHNENKSKGKLNLSSFGTILQGGESGAIIDQSDLGKSVLLQMINYPLDHADHMPPKDEKQLTDAEMTILKDWIMSGAGDQLHFSDLDDHHESHQLIAKRIAESRDSKWGNLPGLTDDKIEELRSNYITISRLFSQSNALEVIVFPNMEFVAGDLKALNPIAENIVELNLSGLELNQKDIQVINTMRNIEKLNLSQAILDDGLFSEFEEFPALNELLISKTMLTDVALGKMATFPALHKVFAHQTSMSHQVLMNYGEKYNVFVIDQAPESVDFKSVLPVPSVENGRIFFKQPYKMALQHPLKGIDIYYSLSEDNSTSSFQKFTDSILIGNNAKLKYYAEKDGWESSPVDSINVFSSSLTPDRYTLTHSPDDKYPGHGTRLLFDLVKGSYNFGDSSWMAFREDPFILNCSWENEIVLSSVTISTYIQTDPYLFPPQSIVVKGGLNENNMNVLARLNPEKLSERRESYFDYFSLSFEPSAINFLQVEVIPMQRLPVWHQGKGQKGWVFVDEVVLNGETAR